MIGSLSLGGRFNIGRDLNPARFPIFPALYLGSDFNTAYAEKFGGSDKMSDSLSPHEFALRGPHSFSSVCLKVTAHNLFDLGTTNNLKAFSSVIQRFDLSAELKRLAKDLGKKPPWLVNSPKALKDSLLATSWRAFPVQFEIPANSQVFAQLLVEAGYQGVIYPSSKGKGNCLALFPQNFSDSGSQVSLLDPVPLTLKYPVLDMDTFDVLTKA